MPDVAEYGEGLAKEDARYKPYTLKRLTKGEKGRKGKKKEKEKRR